MKTRFPLLAVLALTLAAAPARAQDSSDAGDALHGAKGAESAPPVGRVADAGLSTKQGKASVTYGVILNGDTERRHQLNATMLKEHMIRYYGAEATNITVMSTDQGLAPSRENLAKTASDIKKKAGPDDRVIVYTTGHGFVAKHKTTGVVYTLAALPNDNAVTDVAMAGAFLDNGAGSYVYLGDQCYSGGFAKKFTANAAKKVIAISATDDENSTVCGFFIIPFVEASKDAKNDTDKDGRVSEREAYAAAKAFSEKKHESEGFPRGASNALYLTSGDEAKGRGVGK